MAKVCLRAADPQLGAYDIDDANPLIVIGSGEDCEVRLPAGLTEGPHAAIIRLGHTAYLCDLGAPGGTTLNRRRIRWARLADGDEITINGSCLNVTLEEAAELVTGEQPTFRLRDDSSIGEVTTIDPVLIIGSDPGCDVVLYDDAVAPRHALVAWTEEGPLVRRLDRNRVVRLNDKPVTLARLVSGDAMTVGRYRLAFKVDLEPIGLDFPAGDSLAAVGREEAGESEDARGRERRTALIAGRLTGEEGMGWSRLWAEREIRAAEALVAGVIGDTRGEVAGEAEEAAVEEEEGDDTERMIDEGGVGVSTAEAAETTAAAEGVLTGPNSNEQMARMKARIAAAQRALDDRAARQVSSLNRERSRLRIFEAALRRKAAQLLEAVRGNQQWANSAEPTSVESGTAGADDIEAFVEMAAPVESAASSEDAFNEDAGVFNEAETAKDQSEKAVEPRSLERCAAELAELVRSEQEEIDRAENGFVCLRETITHLRESIEQTDSNYEQRKRELEGRLHALRTEQAGVSGERERLMARVQELDARTKKIGHQMEQAGREGAELDHQAERLASSRRQLVEKEDELRTSLQNEHRRMRVRQTELQRKEAELASAARERRREIEAEISRRRAALELREAEIRADRAAIEQAGRAELNKAAAELERVLEARLTALETEAGGSTADETGTPLSTAGRDAYANAASEQTSEDQAAGDEQRELAVSARMSRETVAGRAKRLSAVQDELRALRGAIGRLDRGDGLIEGIPGGVDDQASASGVGGFGRDRQRMRLGLAGQVNNRQSYRAGSEEPAGVEKNEEESAVASGAGPQKPAVPGNE